MKKIFYSIFALIGIGLSFISCDFWKDVMQELVSPIDALFIYYDTYSGKKSSVEAYPNEKIKISYEVTYYSEDVTSCEVVFTSDDEDIAVVETDYDTVYDTGYFYVTAKNPGTCTITMSAKYYTNESCSVDITVKEPPLRLKEHSIQLDRGGENNSKKLELAKNETGKSLIWRSSASAYASVDQNGVVKALRKGSATITVQSYDYQWSDSCEVTVVDSSGVSIALVNGDQIPKEFYPGDEFDLKATVDVGDSGVSDSVSWYSSDSSVVSVNADTGHIKAVGEGTAKIYVKLEANNNVCDYVEVKVMRVPISANQFFWGKWTRMDKGTTYVVEETYVTYDNKKSSIVSSSDKVLEVEYLGKFTKDTENIIMWHDPSYDVDVPFYRQGGTNLNYKVRVVGFEDSISRAAGTTTEGIGKKGLKVKSQSERYSTYTDEGETDENGYVELTAPIQGDSQTLTITNDDGGITVVSGLKIENVDDFMGTIPIVKKDEYSLKITGVVPDAQKTNGYLYANNYKTYPVNLTITNISEVKSETAIASISCSDPNVKLELVNSEYALDEITISSMKGGATKPIQLNVSYGELSSVYKDVSLDVRVENIMTGRVWVDYVPLRFFAGDMPISIAGKSTEGNTNAALNGFVIYPDGNSKFFTVSDNSNKTLYVPVFGKDHKYEMVFSGATVTGELSDSTEMYYTVVFDSATPVEVDFKDTKDAFKFGEPNDSEIKAFDVSQYFSENEGVKSFKAYLAEDDIDFYLFSTDSSSTTVFR